MDPGRLDNGGGTVTFLFTDIDGDAAASAARRRYAGVLAKHRQLVRDDVATTRAASTVRDVDLALRLTVNVPAAIVADGLLPARPPAHGGRFGRRLHR